VLGALAIVIAVLIVLNAQDRKDQDSPPPTITNTITETTPFQSPSAMPGRIGPDDGARQFGIIGVDATTRVPPAHAQHPVPAVEQVSAHAPEQTLQ
jgi:serine/threonine-protein kinase